MASRPQVRTKEFEDQPDARQLLDVRNVSAPVAVPSPAAEIQARLRAAYAEFDESHDAQAWSPRRTALVLVLACTGFWAGAAALLAAFLL